MYCSPIGDRGGYERVRRDEEEVVVEDENAVEVEVVVDEEVILEMVGVARDGGRSPRWRHVYG